jgi:hypothetical protein
VLDTVVETSFKTSWCPVAGGETLQPVPKGALNPVISLEKITGFDDQADLRICINSFTA